MTNNLWVFPSDDEVATLISFCFVVKNILFGVFVSRTTDFFYVVLLFVILSDSDFKQLVRSLKKSHTWQRKFPLRRFFNDNPISMTLIQHAHSKKSCCFREQTPACTI